ncbi:porin [Ideonella azotifigens]|uniref:Porin n=1 Tax=Ideonella azotifigens TaxID=513160 RepID=A0ABN1JUN4_9BURK|nr:porin [Ideonella azotifigens]MCD2341164.1 porin [Ideonella azotifigens]
MTFAFGRRMAPFSAASALFVCAGLQPTLAQDQVTVYGIVDAGVLVSKTGAPGAHWTKAVDSGHQWNSRLGFRASEDLGDGLQAIFNTETGFGLDTGTTVTYGEPASAFWARRSVVGLKGRFGEVLLGRDYSPGFWTIIQSDRNRYGLPGTISVASQLREARINNGVFYNSPAWSGFIGRAAIAAGEGIAGKLMAGSIDYRRPDLFATVSLQRRKLLATSTQAAGHFDEGGFGVEYKLAAYAANLGCWRTDPVTATTGAVDNTRACWIGASASFGQHVLWTQVARTSFEHLNTPSGRAINYGLSYNYLLSKRSNLYASYGGVDNDANTNLALATGSARVGGAGRDADPRGFVAGIKHSF